MSDFKPGDKVTSPLLVGEWEVVFESTRGDWVDIINANDQTCAVHPEDLICVGPSLPPEPPVGTCGHHPLWGSLIRQHPGWNPGWIDVNDRAHLWLNIARRFTPYVNPADPASVKGAGLVKVEDVAAWLAGERKFVITSGEYTAEVFRKRFGGMDDE